MKRVYLFVFAIILIMVSCGQDEQNKNNQKDSSQTTQSVENAETSVPGIEKLEFTDSVQLKANENMRFDKELFRVRAGKKISLIFKNTGSKSATSMSHNVVILKNGVDIVDFAEIAHNAKTEQYVPSSLDSLIIAHTRMVGGGDSDQVEFIIPKPGIYDFICSFPGHWGTMQGKIVAQ
ncbi:MAG TPA: plastocyanin/azurin family copper-binding protein [Puia sp.]|nr:plastocyanin/azurin family copper-binding protein [Puia sp.]